jgi:PIN domain nuclease of toxin-antitoxin system
LRLLLDTHALLWWVHEPEKLSFAAHGAICSGENHVFVSAVSAFEIATKNRKGRLVYKTSLAGQFVARVTELGFGQVSISADHALRAGNLMGDHKDPWDRLLAAQSEIDQLMLVTVDPEFAQFGTHTFW